MFEEFAMIDKVVNHAESPNRAFSDALHPLLYKVMIGVAVWLVVAAWGFFTGSGHIRIMLAVVTWLVMFTVVLTVTLARIGRRHRARSDGEATANRTSFGDWARGDFGLWEGRTKASIAAIEIFLPLGAAATAMTLFAIVRAVVVGLGGAA
jgi:hypothetical protein